MSEIPKDVREEIRLRVWGVASSINWGNMSLTAKAKYYQHWTADPDIGGVLARFMDKGKVRVYLKDTILKAYSLNVLSDDRRALATLQMAQVEILERYTKPHGLRLKDGRVIAWARADDWKLALIAVFERATVAKACSPHALVLFGAVGRFGDMAGRAVVEEAARRLGIARLEWVSH